MRYTFCPDCGQRLTARPIGDEGLVPWCESCQRPWFDAFSTCIIAAAMNAKGEVLLQRETRRPDREVLVAGYIKPGESAEDAARREIKEDGTTVLGQNPWGPKDPIMTVVSFRGEDGAIIANMIHYCCHCTASGKNDEITRDWAGVMTDMLEAQTGAITGFYAGFIACCHTGFVTCGHTGSGMRT